MCVSCYLGIPVYVFIFISCIVSLAECLPILCLSSKVITLLSYCGVSIMGTCFAFCFMFRLFWIPRCSKFSCFLSFIFFRAFVFVSLLCSSLQGSIIGTCFGYLLSQNFDVLVTNCREFWRIGHNLSRISTYWWSIVTNLRLVGRQLSRILAFWSLIVANFSVLVAGSREFTPRWLPIVANFVVLVANCREF